MSLADVAEQVRGLDKMVTGVQVAGVLERERVAAGFGEDAHRRLHTEPRGERGVEHLCEHGAYIGLYPLIEDRRQERPPLLGGHAPIGDERALDPVERTI